MKQRLANSYTARRLGMAGAIASAMLFAVPALAQDSRLSLADRVARLEQQAQNQDQGGVGMVNQMQALQAQMRQMQGQIEELQHQLQELKDSNKAQYTDLDSRIGRLESGAGNHAAAGSDANAAPASAGSTHAASAAAAAAATDTKGKPGDTKAPAAAPADQAGAQAAYDTAFKSLRNGDFVAASRGFRGFIQQYPDSPLMPNAFYWLGESYYGTMNYPLAAETFQRLLSQYAQSDKAPDAMLKLGYSQLELKQAEQGKATLKSVTTKYPGSKAASLAQERLRRLQQQPAN
ncbi:tol-pal system protein YbgF [Dyella sp. LX-66]|uniref:tol-pal system protein YbgF n=1 Tax=unclassified Dyella TaxID=2634549 RepID=UPI001BE05301|nr:MULTISPECIES: tol-pal system protein YbgF [unclassified Dyella]MBT2115519.1 tol-pal system protein YbgF [Dyella sp. LX-1]MBT2139334.1 tol-pal system protein YbgF [Dyella sp. LX-66]